MPTQADKRLYSGAVSNPRELEALQADAASLRRRIGQLEDDELEIMEVSEPVDAQRAELGVDGTPVRRRDRAAHRRPDRRRGRDRRRARGGPPRAGQEAVDVPAELWAEYDRLRLRLDGVAIAQLVGTTCQGCHLQLSAVEIDHIRRLDVDEVVHCEACGRLLVRD